MSSPAERDRELLTVLARAGIGVPRTGSPQLTVYAVALEGWRQVHRARLADGDEPFHVGPRPGRIEVES